VFKHLVQKAVIRFEILKKEVPAKAQRRKEDKLFFFAP
jgi:hypothetical protein